MHSLLLFKCRRQGQTLIVCIRVRPEVSRVEFSRQVSLVSLKQDFLSSWWMNQVNEVHEGRRPITFSSFYFLLLSLYPFLSRWTLLCQSICARGNRFFFFFSLSFSLSFLVLLPFSSLSTLTTCINKITAHCNCCMCVCVWLFSPLHRSTWYVWMLVTLNTRKTVNR